MYLVQSNFLLCHFVLAWCFYSGLKIDISEAQLNIFTLITTLSTSCKLLCEHNQYCIKKFNAEHLTNAFFMLSFYSAANMHSYTSRTVVFKNKICRLGAFSIKNLLVSRNIWLFIKCCFVWGGIFVIFSFTVKLYNSSKLWPLLKNDSSTLFPKDMHSLQLIISV